jgi:hypothetical protein
MDPYLEGPEWHSFHIEFSSAITRDLIPRLRPKYYARTMPYFVTGSSSQDIMISQREIYPDVGVTLKETATTWDITRTAIAPTPIQLQTAVSTQIPHVVVEIFVKASGELVTVIEILSPANKRGKGYDEYLEKRNRLLKSNIHLIEIDWLRQGQRIPMIDPLPDVPYFIFLSRVQTRPIIDVWPIQFNSKLPTIPIPLLPEGEDILSDLQALFTAVYDALDYSTLLDYSKPPPIPLEAETAVWAANLLQKSTDY